MVNRENPLEKLLDRHLPKAQNREFLGFLDAVMLDAVDKSTQAFGRCWSTVPSTLVGQVPLILYRHVFEMADAVHALLLESASVPARLQLRSCFEALVYLEFMLREDKEVRVLAFVASSYAWGLRYARRLEEGSGERNVFLKETRTGDIRGDHPFAQVSVPRETVRKYEECLESEPVRTGYDLLKRFKKEKKRWPRIWCEVVNEDLRSLRDLALYLDRGAEYVMYDLWSRSVHPDLLSVHFLNPGVGRPQRLRKVRDGEKIGSTAIAAVRLLRDATVLVLADTRPGEVGAFEKAWENEVTSRLNEIGEEITIFDETSGS